MPLGKKARIALLGNPNAGKTSLFNNLTGLNQKTGNFPGVTVEKKTGTFSLNNGTQVNLIDLPGVYSIFPKSFEEEIVFDFLTDKESIENTDALIFIADASNLRRNLLLFSQVYDLGIPMVLVLSMIDVAKKDRIEIDLELLKNRLDIPVLAINARKSIGLDSLRSSLENLPERKKEYFVDVKTLGVKLNIPLKDYSSFLKHIHSSSNSINNVSFGEIEESKSEDIIERYRSIDKILDNVITTDKAGKRESFSYRLDSVLIHKVWGMLIFMFLLFLVFQAVFKLAEYPMDWIDEGFAWLVSNAKMTLPGGVFFDLLTEGVLAGIGGVIIFVPQIAILFALLSLLEESGYMARVVFMMDKVMQKFGLNGRSVVPLVSGAACAIPAIMSARSIPSWKERLITIMVTPLISCSARIPVFTILIALVIPDEKVLGVFGLQGLTLFALYLLGFLAAIGSAAIMSLLIKTKEKSFFLIEFPRYKMPRLKNVWINIYNKTGAFVIEAGKIIVAIAIVLWVLASFGPGDGKEYEESTVRDQYPQLSQSDLNQKIASLKIEHSYAGYLGKFIEPVIEPLGFNWKIGIALLTSFAAREVFVATMATIYSIESDSEENLPLKERMKAELNPMTGGAFYTRAVGISLMVFYVFAMQCMSTMAIVYKETNSWKWPILQLVYMTSLAYVSSFLAYNLFS